MLILKEEINSAMDAVLELTKWKLIILAVLTTAGLGLMQGFEHFNYGYLLLLIAPYVCAYVDLLVYEREARVHYIAKYLRHYDGKDAECLELRRYEEHIEKCRRHTTWIPYEGFARIGSSLVASIGIPALTWPVASYRTVMTLHPSLLLIPLVGLGLVVYAYTATRKQDRSLGKTVPEPAADKIEPADR